MGTRLQLALLAGVSGIVLLLLGHAARSATASLLEVPPQSWGTGHLSDAVVAGTCAIGALGALWHVASAALALLALPASHDPQSTHETDVPGLAARILDGWGAPAARRIAASALVVSLSSAPALAADPHSAAREARELADGGMRLKSAAGWTAQRTGLRPNEVYRAALALRETDPTAGGEHAVPEDSAESPAGDLGHDRHLR